MRIHKLEDGDIIKILPMIDKNNKISWIKQCNQKLELLGI